MGPEALRLLRNTFLRRNSSPSFTNCEWKSVEGGQDEFLMPSLAQLRLKMDHFSISSDETSIAY